MVLLCYFCAAVCPVVHGGLDTGADGLGTWVVVCR